jgi:hypothetical protein
MGDKSTSSGIEGAYCFSFLRHIDLQCEYQLEILLIQFKWLRRITLLRRASFCTPAVVVLYTRVKNQKILTILLHLELAL